MATTTKTDILILGAGLGGLATFNALKSSFEASGIEKNITFLDQNDFFTFVPMLHEVASGSVLPKHCTIPLKDIVKGTTHSYQLGKVSHIDSTNKEVQTEHGEKYSYDTCVVALGSVVNFFDIPGTKEHAESIRTIQHALAVKKKFMQTIKQSTEKTMHIAIVGGGYTGVELAGQFAWLARTYVKKEYPFKIIHIHIIEGKTDILDKLPSKAKKVIQKKLEQAGVVFHLGEAVKSLTEKSIILQNNTIIPTDLTIWTAGMKTHAPQFATKLPLEQGRICVNEFLEVTPDLYAIGDITLFRYTDQTTAPQLGELAEAQGAYVGRTIVQRLKQQPIKPFTYRSRGSLIPVGDWWGVVIIGQWVFTGKFAWWIRRTVYVYVIPGWGKKLGIIKDWTLHLFGVRYMTEKNLDE